VSELSASAGSERYGACDDAEGARRADEGNMEAAIISAAA
jgi:hypothetical protein